ncbi:hypothetical protein [Pinibacter aurantiacus]|uniref:Uncharacterized protein n=1 Tax=Pinibacter aurantiacus TaxID=2851599 RepID=A0A9E2W3T7_9BACT|nr:hypothetical protein [Pinibacter aurantiacus]MBV4358920.1 hypothetical protein [Pinibacter aurantiacus]
MEKIFIIVIGVILASCKNISGNRNPKDECKSIECLDIRYNLDSFQINQLIAKKKTLLLFTAWNMKSTTILDSPLINNSEIFEALSEYTIVVQYVDDKSRVHGDSFHTMGDINLQYEIASFNSATQPLYIIYINGLPRCESGYLGKKKEDVLRFFNGCSSASPIVDFGNRH